MAENQEDFYIGDMRIVPSRNLMISGSDARFPLEPRIMDVLCALAKTPRDVVTREHLITEIWQVQYGGDESLTRAISIIRKAFKKSGDPAPIIETIPKRGYRLVRDIGSESPQEAIAAATAPADTTEQFAAPVNQEKSTVESIKPKTASAPIGDNVVAHPKKSEFKPAIRLLLPAAILGLAVGTGWWLGRTSTQDVTFPTSVNHNVDQQPSHAELAQEILFSHLDGQMNKDDAIMSARPLLDMAEKTMPGEPETLVAMGLMHFAEGNFETAHIEFEKAKTLFPNRENAWIGMAYLAARENNLELAQFNLQKAIEVEQFSFRARGKKAELAMRQGNFEGAHEELSAIIAFSPENAFANMLLEKVELFEIYDRNGDQLIMPGEISAEDAELHRLLDTDGTKGLSIMEFRAEGKMEWFPQKGGNKSNTPRSFGSIPIFNIRYDLRNTDAPFIDIDR